MYAEFTKILSRAAVDPRDFALVAFGGAGPVVGRASSRARSASRASSSRARRGRCARSARSAPTSSNDYVRTRAPAGRGELGGAGAFEGAALREHYEALRAELADWLARHGAGSGSATFIHAADMRYVGQSYEIEVPVEPAWLAPGGGPAGAGRLPRAHERRSATPIARRRRRS